MAINFLVQAAANQATLGPLDQVITLLQDFGFFRVILPFLLVFSIVYAVLIKTKVLGEEPTGTAKSAATIVALVSAFLVIVYTPVVTAISTLLPQASFLIIVVVLLLMVLGLFGISFGEKGPFAKKPITLYIIALIVLVLFVAMIGFVLGPDVPALYMFSQFLVGVIPITGEISADTVALLVGLMIILGIVGGVIYMVTKSDTKP